MSQGITGKGVPSSQPAWLLWVKVAIIGLSLVILALSAYAISACGGSIYGVYVPLCAGSIGGFEIFLVIKTWILYGLILFVEFKAPHMFYRLAVIIGSLISIIFWLSGWAWAASFASIWNLGYATNVGGAMAGVAALGALVWILCIVHLVFFIIACNNSPSDTAQPTGVANAELGQMQKPGEYTVQQTYPVQMQPGQYPVQQQQQEQPYPPQAYQQPQPYPTQ